jgi:hypothetical protein
MKFICSFFLVGALLSAAPIITSVKLVDAGNPLKSDGHYYVGPYTLLINGQNVAALCVDFSDESTVGTVWDAYISQVGGNISKTYNPSFSTQYKEEAYLFNLITQPGVTGQQRVDIQHAAWDLTSPGLFNDSAALGYVKQAHDNYSGLDFAGYLIVSTVDSRHHQQEFLIGPNAVAPEPASYALFGLGLCAASAARRWSKRGKQPSERAPVAA